MHQVKIFKTICRSADIASSYNQCMATIEKEINAFIVDNNIKQVHDIKFPMTGMRPPNGRIEIYVTALLIYEVAPS